jgi:hypothetical protein
MIFAAGRARWFQRSPQVGPKIPFPCQMANSNLKLKCQLRTNKNPISTQCLVSHTPERLVSSISFLGMVVFHPLESRRRKRRLCMKEIFQKRREKKMRNSIKRNLLPAGSDDSIFCVPLHEGKKVGFLFFFGPCSSIYVDTRKSAPCWVLLGSPRA